MSKDFKDFDDMFGDDDIENDSQQSLNKTNSATDPFDSMLGGVDGVDGVDFGNQKPKGRNPFNEFAGTVTKNALLPSGHTVEKINQQIDQSLRHTSKTRDNARNTLHATMQAKDKFVNDIAPTLQRTKRVTHRLLNKVEGRLPKFMVDKFKQWTEDTTQDRTSKSTEQMRDELIADQLAKFNEIQVDMARQNEISEETKTLLQNQLEGLRHKDQQFLLAKTAQSTEGVYGFMQTTFRSYLVKSLELQYKSTFYLQDIAAINKSSLDLMDVKLEKIIYNTSLPDMIKAKFSEHFTKNIREQMFGGVSESIMDWTSGFREKTIKHLNENVFQEISGTINDIGGAVADMGEMSIEMEEMSGESSSIESIIGGGLGKLAQTKLIQYLANKMRDANSGGIKRFDEFVKSKTSNLIQKAYDYFQFHENEDVQAIGQKILIDKPKERKVNFFNLEQNGHDVTHFDMYTKKSITDIIPGLLGKILSQVTGIGTKMGADPAEELMFNARTNDFSTISELGRELKKKMFFDDKERQKDIQPMVNEIVARYNNANGNATLLKDNVDNVIKLLVNAGRHNENIVPKIFNKYLTDPDSLTGGERERLDSLMKGIDNRKEVAEIITTAYMRKAGDFIGDSEDKYEEDRFDTEGIDKLNVMNMGVAGKWDDKIIRAMKNVASSGQARVAKAAGLLSSSDEASKEKEIQKRINALKKKLKVDNLTEEEEYQIRREVESEFSTDGWNLNVIKNKSLEGIDNKRVLGESLESIDNVKYSEARFESFKETAIRNKMTPSGVLDYAKTFFGFFIPASWMKKIEGVSDEIEKKVTDDKEFGAKHIGQASIDRLMEETNNRKLDDLTKAQEQLLDRTGYVTIDGIKYASYGADGKAKEREISESEQKAYEEFKKQREEEITRKKNLDQEIELTSGIKIKTSSLASQYRKISKRILDNASNPRTKKANNRLRVIFGHLFKNWKNDPNFTDLKYINAINKNKLFQELHGSTFNDRINSILYNASERGTASKERREEEERRANLTPEERAAEDREKQELKDAETVLNQVAEDYTEKPKDDKNNKNEEIVITETNSDKNTSELMKFADEQLMKKEIRDQVKAIITTITEESSHIDNKLSTDSVNKLKDYRSNLIDIVNDTSVDDETRADLKKVVLSVDDIIRANTDLSGSAKGVLNSALNLVKTGLENVKAGKVGEFFSKHRKEFVKKYYENKQEFLNEFALEHPGLYEQMLNGTFNIKHLTSEFRDTKMGVIADLLFKDVNTKRQEYFKKVKEDPRIGTFKDYVAKTGSFTKDIANDGWQKVQDLNIKKSLEDTRNRISNSTLGKKVAKLSDDAKEKLSPFVDTIYEQVNTFKMENQDVLDNLQYQFISKKDKIQKLPGVTKYQYNEIMKIFKDDNLSPEDKLTTIISNEKFADILGSDLGKSILNSLNSMVKKDSEEGESLKTNVKDIFKDINSGKSIDFTGTATTLNIKDSELIEIFGIGLSKRTDHERNKLEGSDAKNVNKLFDTIFNEEGEVKENANIKDLNTLYNNPIVRALIKRGSGEIFGNATRRDITNQIKDIHERDKKAEELKKAAEDANAKNISEEHTGDGGTAADPGQQVDQDGNLIPQKGNVPNLNDEINISGPGVFNQATIQEVHVPLNKSKATNRFWKTLFGHIGQVLAPDMKKLPKYDTQQWHHQSPGFPPEHFQHMLDNSSIGGFSEQFEAMNVSLHALNQLLSSTQPSIISQLSAVEQAVHSSGMTEGLDPEEKMKLLAKLSNQKSIGGMIGSGIMKGIKFPFKLAGKFGKGLFGVYKKSLPGIFGIGKTAVKGGFSALGGLLKLGNPLIKGSFGLAKKVIPAMFGAGATMGKAAFGFGKKVLGVGSDMVKGLYPAGKAVASGLWGGAKNVGSAVLGGAKMSGKGMFKLAGTIIKGIGKGVMFVAKRLLGVPGLEKEAAVASVNEQALITHVGNKLDRIETYLDPSDRKFHKAVLREQQIIQKFQKKQKPKGIREGSYSDYLRDEEELIRSQRESDNHYHLALIAQRLTGKSRNSVTNGKGGLAGLALAGGVVGNDGGWKPPKGPDDGEDDGGGMGFLETMFTATLLKDLIPKKLNPWSQHNKDRRAKKKQDKLRKKNIKNKGKGNLFKKVKGGGKFSKLLNMGIAGANATGNLFKKGKESTTRTRTKRKVNRGTGKKVHNTPTGIKPSYNAKPGIGAKFGNMASKVGGTLSKIPGASALATGAKVGARFLGPAGVALSAASFANNISKGNYKAAAGDAALAVGASALTGGMAASAGAFLVSNPIGWGILAAGAIGAGAYGIYKFTKNRKYKKKTKEFYEKTYMKMLGIHPSKYDQVDDLEDMINETLMKDKQLSPDDIASQANEFGFDSSNEKHLKYFGTWLSQRFIPMFVALKTLMQEMFRKEYDAIGELESEQVPLLGKELQSKFNELDPKIKEIECSIEGYIRWAKANDVTIDEDTTKRQAKEQKRTKKHEDKKKKQEEWDKKSFMEKTGEVAKTALKYSPVGLIAGAGGWLSKKLFGKSSKKVPTPLPTSGSKSTMVSAPKSSGMGTLGKVTLAAATLTGGIGTIIKASASTISSSPQAIKEEDRFNVDGYKHKEKDDSTLQYVVTTWKDTVNEVLPSVKSTTGIDVPLHLALGLITQESNGNYKARSHAGAQGLIQIMPGTANDLAKRLKLSPSKILTDPKTNLYAGLCYLANIYKNRQKNWTEALTAYNWGSGNLRKYYKGTYRNRRTNSKKPTKETQLYAIGVINCANRILKMIEGKGNKLNNVSKTLMAGLGATGAIISKTSKDVFNPDSSTSDNAMSTPSGASVMLASASIQSQEITKKKTSTVSFNTAGMLPKDSKIKINTKVSTDALELFQEGILHQRQQTSLLSELLSQVTMLAEYVVPDKNDAKDINQANKESTDRMNLLLESMANMINESKKKDVVVAPVIPEAPQVQPVRSEQGISFKKNPNTTT